MCTDVRLLTYSSQSAARNTLQEHNGKEHQHLGVAEAFYDLVFLVLPVLHSGMVLQDLEHSSATILFRLEMKLTLTTAICLSRGVKNHAVMGEEGMAKKRKIPQAIVMGPKIRYRYCHLPNAPWKWPTPFDTPSPINAAIGPPAHHKHARNACSCLV